MMTWNSIWKKLFLILALFSLPTLAGCGSGGSSSSSSGSTGSTTSSSTQGSGSSTTTGLLKDTNLPVAVLPAGRTSRPSSGALQGKTIILSPGHGYFDSPGYWTTQRGVTHGLIEDIHTNEISMDFLIPYLTRAGAYVFSCRERGRQNHEAIVDNDGGSPQYSESGTWSTSSSSGYNNGTYRYATTSSTESATATYRPNLPHSGYYPIYIYYRASSNRPTDALYKVIHTGGTTEFRVDQTKNGNRWLFLGEFYFEKGSLGTVVLSNQSSTPNKAIISDAVRFGCGTGPSGHARWKESADVWTEYIGAPTSQYGDVTTRGYYADWQGGDLFLSVHTNAGGGTGTSSFIHSYSPSAGSSSYRSVVHDQLVGDIRKAIDSNWTDRGKKTANFGELRTTTTMPAMLVELAFHDRVEDAEKLKTPQFRRVCGRALYKGIARYFSPSAPVSPTPPTHLVVKNDGMGQVKLTWRAPSDPLEPGALATGYVVYASTNGYGFDNGRETSQTSLTLSGLTPGAVYYFRVAATNGGGESFPTETLAVRVTPNGQEAGILVVNGFDRLDKNVNIRDGANTKNYIVRQGSAIGEAGYFFDSASNEAVEDGLITLGDYKVANWILGEESTADETFSTKEQQKVTAFLQGGGALLATGSEIGWDLAAKGSSSDKSFLANQLKVDYQSDDAQTYGATGVSGQIFGSLGPFNIDNGQSGTYNVDYPDVIAPQNGAQVVLKYANGQPAAIAYSGAYKVIFVGFPVETITSSSVRKNFFAKALSFLSP